MSKFLVLHILPSLAFCLRLEGKFGPCYFILVRRKIKIQILLKKFSQLKLTLFKYYDSAILLVGFFLKINENICSQKDLYENFLGNFIHSSQKLETTQIPINMKIYK